MRNYFNYFTEIEERFQQRRGSLLLLSTLDWALIETWREAGIPLEAVLRGIDAAFDKYEARQKRARMQRINGLAWCAQAVMQAAVELNEASTGSASSAATAQESGFEHERVAAHLTAAAEALDGAAVAPEACRATAARLRELAAEVMAPAGEKPAAVDIEGLERSLLVLEDKVYAALNIAAPEELLLGLKRARCPRTGALPQPHGRSAVASSEASSLCSKQLLVHYNLPRLSLFYMSQQ